MRGVKAVALIGALIMVVAACGDDDGAVSVDAVWARATTPTANSGAVYMNLASSDGDVLVGVAVDDAIARGIAVHQTVTSDMHDDMGDEMADMHEGMSEEEIAAMESMETAGAMTMMPIARLAIDPGASVSLEPGGYHVMMTDLASPLEAGQTFDLTLTFETAGEVVVEVEVRQDAP
jgi:periplasmic copper chaperone A